ncbi:MAG TPA: FAD-dependent monooxygenase, partial [Xanthobacteraceae bacterium]|nr:FAD-dependent monooxygenase [Xanthobacteraceae bacterium]
MQQHAGERADIVIAGGGFAGLALAIALRQGLGPDFTVVVADPALAGSPVDARASAIAAGARRLFETIGVWGAVAAEAQPILDMVVTDSRLGDAVKPVFLTFAGEVEPDEPFAHMVENRPLVEALVGKAREEGVVLRPCAVAAFEVAGERVVVRLADGATTTAALLIAADGARSRLRELAGIATFGWSYGQSGIVTTVAHERDHDGRAEEHFLPAG